MSVLSHRVPKIVTTLRRPLFGRFLRQAFKLLSSEATKQLFVRASCVRKIEAITLSVAITDHQWCFV